MKTSASEAHKEHGVKLSYQPELIYGYFFTPCFLSLMLTDSGRSYLLFPGSLLALRKVICLQRTQTQ